MLRLAEQYAARLGTILSHRQDGENLIFVLASGPKLRMNEAELLAALGPADEKAVIDLAVDDSAVLISKKRKKEKTHG